MLKNKLQLSVVSQEKKLLSQEVDLVTLPTQTGEITILPDHIPLLSQLQTGELRYMTDGQEQSIVISQGIVDKGPDNTITVIVDSATHARDISVQKAEQAIKQAHETMKQTVNQRELLLAEASLRQAMWEIKVAQKTRKARI